MPRLQKLSTGKNIKETKKFLGKTKHRDIAIPSEANVIRQLRKKLQKDFEKIPKRHEPIGKYINLPLASSACLEGGIEEGILCLLADIHLLLFRMKKVGVCRWIVAAKNTLMSEIDAERAAPKPL
jgi:hypothetical protein